MSVRSVFILITLLLFCSFVLPCVRLYGLREYTLENGFLINRRGDEFEDGLVLKLVTILGIQFGYVISCCGVVLWVDWFWIMMVRCVLLFWSDIDDGLFLSFDFGRILVIEYLNI